MKTENEYNRFLLNLNLNEVDKLIREWELHKEAHNGFDTYLAYVLIRERKALRTLKKDFKELKRIVKLQNEDIRSLSGLNNENIDQGPR